MNLLLIMMTIEVYIETYEFKRYSKVNYKYIKNTEFQSVMKNKYRVEDLWEKYFVN